MRARRHARAAPYVLSLWAPGDMVVTAESEVEAEQMKAATWGANGLILGHPRHTPQSFNDKTVAIFVPADSALAIRYTATRQDVGALMQYNLRHSPRLWIMLGAVALFPAVLNSLLALSSRGQVTSVDVVPGLIFGAIGALCVPAFVRLRTKKDERVLSIAPEGIQTSIGKLSGAVEWKRIASVDETPEYIFITGKSGNGFAIPSRAFANGSERAEFLRRVAEYRSRGHSATA